VADGRSYDIPFGALVSVSLGSVLVAGRCVSSEREANGSARVIGTAAAMGQAAGTAAAMIVGECLSTVRDVDLTRLRREIVGRGGVVEGTN
jgi:hypothetical protein